MTRIIDVHIHVGHRFEWSRTAKDIWMDTGPYVPEIYDEQENQLPKKYGEALKREGIWGGILIPEYSPKTSGVMPFERAVEIHQVHPELIPFANLNPNVHPEPMTAFEKQLEGGAKGLKIHPIHGFFYANDSRLYRLHTLTAINANKGQSFPLISLVAPANHHDSHYLKYLVQFGKAIGLDLRLITADEAYHDNDDIIYSENEVHLIKPPGSKISFPENVDKDTLQVMCNDYCETPMEYAGIGEEGHEYKCGAEFGQCLHAAVCPG